MSSLLDFDISREKIRQYEISDVKKQEFLEYFKGLAETSGKVFKNLTYFRDPYDLNSKVTQNVIGVIGASGLFQSPEEAKEFYDSSPKGKFGTPGLLLSLFQKHRERCLKEGNVHVFVQFTPWNFYDQNEKKGKSPKQFYEVLKKVHETCPGFYTFGVTIVKQFGKGTVAQEPGWSKAVNKAFIESACEANCKAGYRVVEFIGAASNEAPQEGQTIPPAGVGSWKPTSEHPGQEAVQKLISIIDKAKESLVEKYGEAKVKELCNLPLSIHAGEEHNTGHYDPTDFVKAVSEHPNTVGIGHGVSVGKALLEGKNMSTTQMTGGQQIIKLDPWLESVRAKGIIFEVCLTSNQCINSSGPSFEYLDQLMNHGFACALGTDDPALFKITLCDEYLKYAEHLWYKCFRKGFGMGVSIELAIYFVQGRLTTLANNSLKYAGNYHFTWPMYEPLLKENLNLGIDTSSVDNDKEFPEFPREPFQAFVKALHKCDVHTHIGALFPLSLIAECLDELN